MNVSEKFIEIEEKQSEELNLLHFGSVAYVYNPLEYAKEPHNLYVQKYCKTVKDIIFLGMNPGPYGMVQTGVPFGEINAVRNWLKIGGTVFKPPKEHPQKIVKGFECKRSEVSGKRFWSLFEELCGCPETFFNSCFVHNYCPLAFLSSTGKNITPPTLHSSERKLLETICNESLCAVIKLLEPKYIIGIGKFAEEQTKKLLKSKSIEGVQVGSIMHPSPVNPAANRGWKEVAIKQLQELGVMPFVKNQFT